MKISAYSACQRRAINQVWTVCGDYRFEPQFLAMRSDGQPDLYMNCIIGLVHKWFGDDMPKKLFASWAGDARQTMYDDLAWLALENAVYEKELPGRPALDGLRRAHASAFFSSEYRLSRQEWMAKNQLVYAVQSARWKSVLGQKPPVLTPWEKGLSAALACPGTLSGEELADAIREAFRKYLHFDGDAHAKKPFSLHFGERWVPLLTRLFTTEMVRTDDLAIDRSAAAGGNGMVRASNALRAQLRSNEQEDEDRDYVEGCFGRSLYPPKELALIEQQTCTGNHLGCHLWFTRGEPAPGKTMRADVQHLFDQTAEQAERNRADFLKNNDLYQSAILHLTGHIRNCMQVQQQPDAVSARQGHADVRRIWRLPVLNDGRVFLRSEEESNPGFTVDLLLDGSASRLLNNSNGGSDWAEHDVNAEQVYGRQRKSRLGSERLYELTDCILKENIAKGSWTRGPRRDCRSFPLYSTAMTVPSPAMSAASTAMDSPEMMQTVSSDAMCILLRMTARISLPT